ncbi:MAG: ribosome biogenesis GTP-binding protein YihA/YsxC [Desulfobacteraceae bacterium]
MIIKQTEFVKSATRPSQYPEPEYPEIAFAGRSNVGKSSFINTLLNRKNLVKTSSKPGCTQLINFFKVNNDLYFVDLPGYGYAKVSKKIRAQWQPMVKNYFSSRKNLAGVVLLIDIRRDPGNEEMDLVAWLASRNIPCLIVLTKADKLSKTNQAKRHMLISKALDMDKKDLVRFSAKSRLGRETALDEIQWLTRPL